MKQDRIDYFKSKMVPEGVPCRFLKNGQAMNVLTGALCSKGSNVIYHPTYWNFSRETANELAAELGVKVVFAA